MPVYTGGIVFLLGNGLNKKKGTKMKLVATDTKVTIKWFVWAGDEKIARNASMRGAWDGWDAICSCGWTTGNSRTVYSYTKNEVNSHKFHDHNYSYKVGA